MNWITTLLGNLNYSTITFLMLLESTVVPVPSELVVAPAAYHICCVLMQWLFRAVRGYPRFNSRIPCLHLERGPFRAARR